MTALDLGITLFIVASLVWLVLAQRHSARAQSLVLLRCLFPAWRFFEAIGPKPVLSYRRYHPETEQFGAWQDVIVWRASACPLPLNALGNLQLAYQSLIERFESDLEEPPDPAQPVEHWVSYKLVRALVLNSAAADGAAADCQFRLQLMSDGDRGDVFVSERLVVT